MIGNGIGAGANAFRAIASITVESLPPENSRHGPAHLRRDLAEDEDALGLEGAQVRQDVRLHGSEQDLTGGWAFRLRLSAARIIAE